MWEFIKENKKGRKEEMKKRRKQENKKQENKNSTKKVTKGYKEVRVEGGRVSH